MRASARRPFVLAAACLAIAACRPAAGRGGEGAAPRDADLSDFRLTLVQSGGIAGIVTTVTLDGATRRYTLHRGRCVPGDACGAPLDSASGTLPERDVREIRAAVEREWGALRADYGSSASAADLFTYEIEVRSGGREKRIVADDLTLPPALQAIRDRLFRSIDAARGR